MDAMITSIKRAAVHDGDGLRTTVFFKGCPLKCIWCHNPESISPAPQLAKYDHLCIRCGICQQHPEHCPTGATVIYGKSYTVEQLLPILLQDVPFFQESGGGVTLSGGECLMQPEFATALACELHKQNISVNVDTCGFVNWHSLEAILPYTDTFLYDLKAIDPKVHRRCTGQDNAIILENLTKLCDRGCKVEIRYPLVVGYNDTECAKIGEFLQNKPGITKVKVLQYHNFAASRYQALSMENTLPEPQTTPAHVAQAIHTLQGFGLAVTTDAKML